VAEPTESSELLVRLGRRINELRTQRGYTLHALCKRAELDFGHLQGIESGSRNASIFILSRIASALSVGLPVLLDLPSDVSDEARRADQLKRLCKIVEEKLSLAETDALLQLLDRLG
jgi:transcriptional regulator with XRE-family HTH domain